MCLKLKNRHHFPTNPIHTHMYTLWKLILYDSIEILVLNDSIEIYEIFTYGLKYIHLQIYKYIAHQYRN